MELLQCCGLWLLPDPVEAGRSWSHGGAGRSSVRALELELYRPGVDRHAAGLAGSPLSLA
jgi:hypothetical protein